MIYFEFLNSIIHSGRVKKAGGNELFCLKNLPPLEIEILTFGKEGGDFTIALKVIGGAIKFGYRLDMYFDLQSQIL